MKVYIVWQGAYEDAYIDEVFATRELAERYVDTGGTFRREWERLIRRAGREIPNAFWIRTERDADGKVVKRWKEPKVHPHPGDFDVWIRSKDRGYIEEYNVRED